MNFCHAEHNTPVDPLDVLGQVLLVVNCNSTYATVNCPFPNMLCSIVIVQLLLWPELFSREDAGVHLQQTRLHDVSASSSSASLWATHHICCRLRSLDHDLTSKYYWGVSSHMATAVGGGWYHLRAHSLMGKHGGFWTKYLTTASVTGWFF